MPTQTTMPTSGPRLRKMPRALNSSFSETFVVSSKSQTYATVACVTGYARNPSGHTQASGVIPSKPYHTSGLKSEPTEIDRIFLA